MSGNVLPAAAPPIVSGLPNWFARAAKTAESGFNDDTICFWGDSTTATCLNFFGGCPLPVTYPTFAAARFVNFHQKPGEALAGTRLLNFGNTGASLAALLADNPAAAFGITRLLSANHQIHWPAGAAPIAGDTVTIGGTVFTFIASGATPSGNQVRLGADFGGSIVNLVSALQASTDAQVAKNSYASRSSNYDVSYALDIWSKRVGPAGAGQAVACSSAGALINGSPKLQVPGLVVLCLGINDIRNGATSQAQLIALLTQAVNRIRGVLPTTDIVLWGPNSFLTDDPTAAGLISPETPAAAQGYSSLLYGAYAALRNVWPNVVVLQKQDIFGKTCVTYAAAGGASGTMSDQLHPALGAQREMADWLAPIIGFKQPFNAQRANLARVANPAAPYLVYPREVEDPAFYDVIAQAAWLGQGTVSGNDYMDFLFPGARYGEILPGDVVQMGAGGAVFQVPLSGVYLANLNTTTTRFLFTGTGLLPPFSGGTVTVYRHKYEWDATVQNYLQQLNAYPYRRRFFCPAAGSGYMRLYPLAQNSRDPAMVLLNPATDVIVGPGLAVTGWDTLPFSPTANWQLTKSGTDFSALYNRYVWLLSTFPKRDTAEEAFDPIRLTLVGPIAGTSYVRQIATRGAGKVNRVFYEQGTAGTSDLTIALKVNGTQVVSFLVTPGHVGLQSTTWASGSSFAVFPGHRLEWTITGGAGAADIAVALDIGG